jgi:HEPN domain-containing protein
MSIKGLNFVSGEGLPPKVHNLLYLIEKIGITLPEDLFEMVFEINRASIPTRYPEDLKQIQKDYRKQKVEKLLIKSKEALKWLKVELPK